MANVAKIIAKIAGEGKPNASKRILNKRVEKMVSEFNGAKNPAKYIAKGTKKNRKFEAEQNGAKKPMTTGMKKVMDKSYKNERDGGRIIGSPYVAVKNGKYTVLEYMTGKKVKGKGKDVMNNARDVERKAGVRKKVEPLRYAKAADKRKPSYTASPSTPKVPVKTSPKKKK